MPELTKALQDSEPMVRVGAGLGRIGPGARPALSALESASELGLGPDLREVLQARSRIEGPAKNLEPQPAYADAR